MNAYGLVDLDSGWVLSGHRRTGDAGGFWFIFFGVGAILVGIVESAFPELPDWIQWALFSAFSIVSLALFRKPLLRRLELSEPMKPVDSLVGESAVATEAMAPGAAGRADLRGSTWKAKNAGDQAIAVGQACEVTKVDELTIWVVGR